MHPLLMALCLGLTAPCPASGSPPPEGYPAPQPPAGSAYRMTEATYESWSGGSWDYTTRATYTYVGEDDDRIAEVLYETWDGSSWESSYRYVYGYDSQERLETMLYQQRSGSSWQDRQLSTYTYEGGEEPRQVLTQTWSGGWVNSTLTTYEYQSGNMTESLVRTWSAADSWENSWLYTYDYRGELLSETLGRSWSGSSWVNHSLTTYTYQGDLLSESLLSDWSGSAWESSLLCSYTYSGGRLSEVLYETWEDGWVDWMHYQYSYDVHGNNNMVVARTRSGGSWVNSSRSTFRWEEYESAGETGNPSGTLLSPPSPSPATGAVSLVVRLEEPGRVELAVYDLRGRLLELLHDAALPAGRSAFEWEGEAPPGVYVVVMEALGRRLSAPVVLLD